MGAPNVSGLTGPANALQAGQASMFGDIMSQLGGGYGQFANAAQSLLGPLSGVMGNIVGGPGAMTPAMMQQFMTLGANPSALAAFTGINAPGMVQNATNYLSAPGQTNMAQMFPGAMAGLAPGQSVLNMAGPQAMNVFRGMTQGINPQFALNAQNQLQQQYGTSVADILGQAAPGQNTGAQMLQAQNQLLQGSSNLAGQLAGQSQQIAAQGAQGLVGTGQAMDANTLQRIMGQFQMAGGLDQQTMNMLMNAAQMGTGYNQMALGNIGQAAGMGMQGLGAAQNLAQLGVGMNQYGMNMMSGMGTTMGTEAGNYMDMAVKEMMAAPNPWMVGAQLLGGLAGAYMGGPGASNTFLQGAGKGGGGSSSTMNASGYGSSSMPQYSGGDGYPGNVA
jgi:hypothetical protein